MWGVEQAGEDGGEERELSVQAGAGEEGEGGVRGEGAVFAQT